MINQPRFACAAVTAAALLLDVNIAVAEENNPYGGNEFVTEHGGVFNGNAVHYTASFSETIVRNDDGAPIARFYSTDYVADNTASSEQRPIIFIWNGGPSAASATLHMAGFGPKRLVNNISDDDSANTPFKVAENTHTLLDIADLVFVDPAETGYSRILPDGDENYFYSVEGDAESVARFIETWLSEHGRTESPIFIMGTSYGSIRAAVVARYLAATKTPLTGVILFSQGVNLVETTQRANSLVGYASNISQLAAIAWFHGMGEHQDGTVYEALDKAHTFAMNEYLIAIAKGRDIPAKELNRVARRLSGFIGIDQNYLKSKMLLINKGEFRRELLKDKGLALLANDARQTFSPDDGRPVNSSTEHVGEAQLQHLSAFLQVTFPADEYQSFAPGTGNWDYGGSSTLGGARVPPGAARSVFSDFDWPGDLAEAFTANASFRLFIATGVYDTLTTSGPARLLAADVDFPGERVELHEYEGGHAFYANDAEFERLSGDLRKFILKD